MDKITLKNMAFYGYHGMRPEEKSLGQRFYVDISLFLNLSEAGQSDNIHDTVNYAGIYEVVKQAVEGKPCRLIERLADGISCEIMKKYPKVIKIKTTIRKPLAPVPGPIDDVSVTVKRKRKL
jgi:dihydroneopterin aldolase